MTRTRATTTGGDQGVALVIAIGVIVVAMALSVVIATVAIRQSRASGVDRQRAVAVNAAEAGVDATFTAFQSSGPTLPCGPDAIPALNAQVPVDQPSVTVDVQYFQVDGVTPITDCAVIQANLTRTPMKALITATGTTTTLAGGSTNGKRAMQAFVTVRPKIAQGFDKAIFANGTLTVKNNHDVLGNGGNDADVYSNTAVICENGSNQTYHGSIYSQGAVQFDGQCSALGQVWAKDQVVLGHNQSTVGGNVISSTSSVSVASVDKVAGTIMAGTTINPSCTAPKCITGLVQGPPPSQPFPQMPLSKIGDWTAAPPTGPGYERLPDYAGDCGKAAGDAMAADAKLGGPGRVIHTTCQVGFSKTKDIPMTNDLVIYADGGFSSSQQVTLTSGDGQTHRLYWIVPYGVTCNDLSGDITTDNDFSVLSAIDLMLYTPCDMSIQNQSTHFGQIYGGGNVTLENKFDMNYRPLPMFGIDQTSLPLLSYDVDIIYKREVRP